METMLDFAVECLACDVLQEDPGKADAVHDVLGRYRAGELSAPDAWGLLNTLYDV
jgi:hypothetical protein